MQFNWKIVNLERRTTDNFVTTAHWRCDVRDENLNNGINGTVIWEEGEPEISFENLTPETVLNWVWEKINRDEIEGKLTEQIESMRTPSIVSGVPWVTNNILTPES
jgi:hypothetical protein